ncbi:hypothetical protein Fmac_025473 [Flemingia macrophylla]|uniref:Uncharacterized protein n=1 Tax=Flemingia macrophylla TaxID=520843 RepID=A0ABD1LSB2_9FABA
MPYISGDEETMNALNLSPYVVGHYTRQYVTIMARPVPNTEGVGSCSDRCDIGA